MNFGPRSSSSKMRFEKSSRRRNSFLIRESKLGKISYLGFSNAQIMLGQYGF